MSGEAAAVKTGSRTQDMIYCAMFTVLIAVGAFIKIPVPVIPFTLQVFFIYLAGALLGAKWGAASAVLYMLLGLIGVPVFTEGGGFWYILKPSFGYIIGFCVGAWVIGKLTEHKKLTMGRVLAANFTGLAIIYVMGMIYYYVICNYVIQTPISVGTLFLYCFFMVVPGDAVLAVLGGVLAKRLKPIMNRLRNG